MNTKRRTRQQIMNAKQISNQLFVSIIKCGRVVESLYNKQLKEKYSSLYRQFLQLQKQLKEQLAEGEINAN